MQRRSWLWWITVVGATASVLGQVGVLIAEKTYPKNNLLGGWALLFGPIEWLGILLLMIAAVGCSVSIVRALLSNQGTAERPIDPWALKLKRLLSIMSAAFVVVTLGIGLALVAVPDFPVYLDGMQRGSSEYRFLPGGSDYMLFQLSIAFVAASLTWLCVRGRPGKTIRLAAVIATLFAILVSLVYIYWLPWIIFIQSFLFLRFQHATLKQPN
jgi:hypothetical protein